MAFTGGIYLTNGGRRLLSLAQTGEQLIFTRFQLGDGTLTGLEIERTALVSPKDDLEIARLRVNGDGTCTIGAIRDADAPGGYYFRELGLWAQDPENEGAEILYAYGNAGDSADYLPAAGGAEIVEKAINLIVSIGNAENVDAVIGGGIYLTMDDLTWQNIGNKPGVFPPSAHAASHASNGSDPVTPASIGAAAASHTHTPASIGAAASSHTHTIAQVTSLQATLNAKATTALYTVSVPITGWSTGTGQYTRTLTVTGILATDTPIVDAILSTTAATRDNQLTSLAAIELITTAANSITIYANSIPKVALTLRLKVVR